MTNKKRVLILCTGNSARSQMAEGLLRRMANDIFTVESAGTDPGRVRAEAIAVMNAVGIDISDHRSKSVDEFAGRHFDVVITVCDNAKETCPTFPGKALRLHQNFSDPALAQGDETTRFNTFRQVRDQISNWLEKFVGEQRGGNVI